jgi:hypothetical protein
MLRQDTQAWECERHAQQTGVDWHCTTEDVRKRLKTPLPTMSRLHEYEGSQEVAMTMQKAEVLERGCQFPWARPV